MDMQIHLQSDRDMRMSTYEDTEALTFVDVRRRGARTGKECGGEGQGRGRAEWETVAQLVWLLHQYASSDNCVRN